MAPSRQMDRIASRRWTVVGVVVAALSVMLTSIFSWLALRETRIARVEQREYFAAEKPPIIALVSAEYRNGTFFLVFENRGESAAFRIHTQAMVHGGGFVQRRGGDAVVLALTEVDDPVPNGQRVLHRGESWALKIKVVAADAVRKAWDVEPQQMAVGATHPHDGDYLSVSLSYADLVGTVHSTVRIAVPIR